MATRGSWAAMWIVSAIGAVSGCGEGKRYLGPANGSGGEPAMPAGGGGASGSHLAGSSGVSAGGSPGVGQAGSPDVSEGGEGGTDESVPCTSGESKSCYESAEGKPYKGTPAANQTTCRLGKSSCEADGKWGICIGAIAPQAADTCEPGNDASCNGTPNEGCTCKNGDTRPCGLAIGNCKLGSQTCADSNWGACVGEVKPAAADTCDQDDDANCNGAKNEGCSCVNGVSKQCGSNVGSCKFGTVACVAGKFPDTCTGGVAAAAKDTCEPGNDANCNATPNEGCGCTGSTVVDCGKDTGACSVGKQSCVNGTLSACVGAVNPTTKDTCLAATEANDTNCNGTYGDGCDCLGTDAPKTGCGDTGCGKQTCNGSTGKLNACSGDGTTLRCNPNALDDKQICGSSGVWLASACPAGSVCRSNGATCKLIDGQGCTTSSDCASSPCTAFSLDADKDGYRANATQVKFCGTSKSGYVAVAAGQVDDCNDSNAAVHPGATEVCDHLDNDCNGKVDMNDALTLGGTTLTIGSNVGAGAPSYFYPSIAWSSDSSAYAIGHAELGDTANLRVDIRNQAGAAIQQNLAVGMTGLLFLGGSGTIGAAYTDGGGTVGSQFRLITPSTGAMTAPAQVGTETYASVQGVARVPSGNWATLYSWIDYDTNLRGVKAQLFTPAGAASGAAMVVTTGATSLRSITGLSNGFLVVFSAGGSVTGYHFDPTFTTHSTLALTGSQGVAGSGSSGFAVATKADGTAPTISIYQVNNTKNCGPISFADSSFIPSSIAPSGTGYVVMSTSTKVQEILSDCSAGQLFTVDTSGAATEGATIAAGSNGYGVTWMSGYVPKFRNFGSNFCN